MSDLLTFTSWNGHAFALMGVHIVGAVRERAGAAEWTFTLEPNARWHPARDAAVAREQLSRYAAAWYDAAHTPLEPGQGERLARHARVG